MNLNRKLAFWIMWSVAAMAIIAVAAIFVMTAGKTHTPSVILPTAAPVFTPTTPGEGGDDSGYIPLEVTAETVQAVMATLSRAENYHRVLVVTTYYSGGSSSSQHSVWAKGSSLRIVSVSGGITKNTLILGDELWIWYDNPARSFHGRVSDSPDVFQGIPTYEDFLTLDAGSVLDAGYTQYAGEPCVWASYQDGPFNYTHTVYVSVATGLLMGSESVDEDGAMVHAMVSGAPEITTPDDLVFQIR